MTINSAIQDYVNFLTEIEHGVVYAVAVDRGMEEVVECVRTYRLWEVCHGIDRWQEFKDRGVYVGSGLIGRLAGTS